MAAAGISAGMQWLSMATTQTPSKDSKKFKSPAKPKLLRHSRTCMVVIYWSIQLNRVEYLGIAGQNNIENMVEAASMTHSNSLEKLPRTTLEPESLQESSVLGAS